MIRRRSISIEPVMGFSDLLAIIERLVGSPTSELQTISSSGYSAAPKIRRGEWKRGSPWRSAHVSL